MTSKNRFFSRLAIQSLSHQCQLMEDLGDRYSVGLIQDIALTAESIYASCTKPKIDQTFVEKLSNLKDKVVSFMFLDDRATKIADSIQSVLNHLPSGNLDSPFT